MDVSIIIPNYNGEELLKENLPKVADSIASYKNGSNEIIVVDDASTDASVSVISNFKSHPDQIGANLKFLRNLKNLGFSSTVNKGVKEAKGEIIILLNTDVRPDSDFYKPLLPHFSDEKVFAVACMDKSVEGEKVVLRGRGIGRWQKGFLVHKLGDPDKDDTLWASGGSSAFRKSIWNKLHGFNEMYNPAYWEDIDLSYRALKSGYKIIFEKKSTVLHEHTKGAIKKRYSAFQIRSIAYRNQFYFVWNNLTDIDLVLEHIIFLPLHFFKAFLHGDMAFFIGFFKAFLHLPNSIKSNIDSRQFFVKNDKDVTQSINA